MPDVFAVTRSLPAASSRKTKHTVFVYEKVLEANFNFVYITFRKEVSKTNKVSHVVWSPIRTQEKISLTRKAQIPELDCTRQLKKLHFDSIRHATSLDLEWEDEISIEFMAGWSRSFRRLRK